MNSLDSYGFLIGHVMSHIFNRQRAQVDQLHQVTGCTFSAGDPRVASELAAELVSNDQWQVYRV